jgi:hypothetical protein
VDDRLVLIRTGEDIAHDSMKFEILQSGKAVYKDAWPLTAYFETRPQLSDEEKRRVVRLESDRFFNPSAFMGPDSLSKLGTPLVSRDELYKFASTKELAFLYYQGDRGSRGIVWSPERKQFIVAWKS